MPYRTHIPCSVEGCERAVIARGLCGLHYDRFQRLGSTELPVRQKVVRACSVEGCGRRANARGWCGFHYYRWQRCGDPLGTLLSKDPARRFWTFVDKNGPIHPVCGQCWVWARSKNRGGYGIFVPKKGGDVVAHRYSWELANGPIPDGLRVLHRCDNPPCVNPAHLFLGTQTDNMADMAAKGRDRRARGERSATAKLTADDVRDILARYRRGHRHRPSSTDAKALAAEYGVGLGAIYAIVSGQTWNHVTSG